jgi:hypothetical protein
VTVIQAFKRWLAKAAYEGAKHDAGRAQSVVENRLLHLMESRPTVLAWHIDNGFLLAHREFNRDEMRMQYCADHQAIADHLISIAAQKTLFPSNAGQVNIKAAPSYRPGVI